MESSLVHLFAGYSAVWLVIVAYLLRLRRCERELRREVEVLRQCLQADHREGGS